ncbi:MAG: hypothetical protein N4A63_09710 [Vallitalea sp.]|jgi:hypothetical protein|nr:hypothetical protein [Vallitalea sp.]
MFYIREYKHRRLLCTLISFLGGYSLHFIIYKDINLYLLFPFKATCIIFAIGGYRYSAKKYLDFNRKRFIFTLEMIGWAATIYSLYIYIFFEVLQCNAKYVWIF